jgi:hypothetical protein
MVLKLPEPAARRHCRAETFRNIVDNGQTAEQADESGAEGEQYGRDGKSCGAEEHRASEMPHTLAGNITRSSPPHNRSRGAARRQRHDETDGEVRESHCLHDLGQPEQETVNCAEDDEQDEGKRKNPGVARSGLSAWASIRPPRPAERQ